jgi:hypothetical protein
VSTRRKQRRHRHKPFDLTLDELGLLTHIRTHLVDGKFQHRNKATGAVFGVNESTISRLVARLEEKGAVKVDRTYDTVRGKWNVAVISPQTLHAPLHVGVCVCYQDLKSPSGSPSNEPTCTGEEYRAIEALGSISLGGALTHAQVHVALETARARLQRAKDARTSNCDYKRESYHAKEVRQALAEVRRLEDLSGGAR